MVLGRVVKACIDKKKMVRSPLVLVLQSADQQQAISIGQTALGLSVGVMDMNVAAWQNLHTQPCQKVDKNLQILAKMLRKQKRKT